MTRLGQITRSLATVCLAFVIPLSAVAQVPPRNAQQERKAPMPGSRTDRRSLQVMPATGCAVTKIWRPMSRNVLCKTIRPSSGCQPSGNRCYGSA